MKSNDKNNIDMLNGFNCPLPITNYDTIQMSHGAGGRMMNELIQNVFINTFKNDTLIKMEDQATLNVNNSKITFTTDSFVVDPIFFKGGNIGTLAINGTVNDLSMNGAKPLWLSAAFIIEEGFPIEELNKIVISMREAADIAGVEIVTGDTKVVDKGSCDKVFINTAGIGILDESLNISSGNLIPGDVIIVSGTIADHGMAIMTTRKGLSFQNSIESDCAALNSLVEKITNHTKEIHAMRDPTRGGVAATLHEFCQQSNIGIKVFEKNIPMKENVRGACEILGINPLFVANEGKLILSVPKELADSLLDVMQSHPLGKDSAIIGEVVNEHPGILVNKSLLGVEQIIDLPLGEQLPRIC